jgi:hypothetical protein
MLLVCSMPRNIDGVDYNGPRTAKGLTDFAKQNMENLVVRVTDENINAFLEGNVHFPLGDEVDARTIPQRRS